VFLVIIVFVIFQSISEWGRRGGQTHGPRNRLDTSEFSSVKITLRQSPEVFLRRPVRNMQYKDVPSTEE